MSSAAGPDSPTLWVICLCAEWCNVCRDWRQTFENAAAGHPGTRFAWVDVEDEDEAMGDFDVETFPTVLIASGDDVLFLGPVQPSGAQFARLVERLTHQGTDEAVARASVSGEAQALLARLKVGALPKP